MMYNWVTNDDGVVSPLPGPGPPKATTLNNPTFPTDDINNEVNFEVCFFYRSMIPLLLFQVKVKLFH